MTLTEFNTRIEALGANIDTIVENSMERIMYNAEALIMERIFNKNENTQGKKFGQYSSEEYKNFRKSRGLQTNHVDLQVDGDLMRSIATNVSSNGYAVIIKETPKKPYSKPPTKTKDGKERTRKVGSGTTTLVIARRMDKNYGLTFGASSDEVKESILAGQETFNDEIKRILKLN